MGVLFKHGHPLKITSLIPLKISYIYIYLWEKKNQRIYKIIQKNSN